MDNRRLAKELTKRALMQELEADITDGMNFLAHAVVNDLEEMAKRQDQTIAVWTGMYGSSWKVSQELIEHKDDIFKINPWKGIKLRYGNQRPPKDAVVIERRHPIPRITIDKPMYIANTVAHTKAAFGLSRGITGYAHQGIKKRIDMAFSDKVNIRYRANIPRARR